jgi:hypothetical protein
MKTVTKKTIFKLENLEALLLILCIITTIFVFKSVVLYLKVTGLIIMLFSGIKFYFGKTKAIYANSWPAGKYLTGKNARKYLIQNLIFGLIIFFSYELTLFITSIVVK